MRGNCRRHRGPRGKQVWLSGVRCGCRNPIQGIVVIRRRSNAIEHEIQVIFFKHSCRLIHVHTAQIASLRSCAS